MLTLEQAKSLKIRQVLLLNTSYGTNADGTPTRWRVNGKVKTWKRDSSRVQVPIKRGLWECGYLTEHDLSEFTLA